MALNLITPTFGPVVLAKNPVIFRLRSLDDTNQPYAAQGASAKITAGGGAKFANGQTLTVTYTEPDGTTETVVFTATADYLIESEIPDSTFPLSISEYWETVRIKVTSHHRISPYFRITRVGPLGGNALIFKAISSNPLWQIELSNTAGFTVTADVAVEDTTPVNYSVLFEVYFERTYGGGDYMLTAQLKNTPDSDGYLFFDISSILEAECRAGIQEPVVPEWGQTESFLGDNIRRYYVRYTEEYGTPIAAQEWQYDSVRRCMNGGVSQSVNAQGDYLASLDADNSFLTWMPDGRKISLDQPEYLSWYNWDVVDRYVVVQMRWTDIEDGTVSTPTQHLLELRVKPQEVAIIPVNPTLLGLDGNDTAYKYQVRVVYQDGESFVAVSQWRTYYIDRDYYLSERYVQYLNGFGVTECWRCTGVWGKKLNVQRSVAERPVLPNFNEFATDRFQYAKQWDHELTYRTGFLRKSEADVLQEMLLSGEVYDVAEDGHIPLLIQTNSFAVTDSEEDLHSYQFACRPRIDTRNYSKVNIDNLLTGAWQEPGGEAWFDALLIHWELP